MKDLIKSKKEDWVKPKMSKLQFKDTLTGTNKGLPESSSPIYS